MVKRITARLFSRLCRTLSLPTLKDENVFDSKYITYSLLHRLVGDGKVDPDVEIDEDNPGDDDRNQQLHVLLVDLVVQHIVGKLQIHSHFRIYFKKFWDIKC